MSPGRTQDIIILRNLSQKEGLTPMEYNALKEAVKVMENQKEESD